VTDTIHNLLKLLKMVFFFRKILSGIHIGTTITINTCSDKIGYLFNNTYVNVTSSGVGVAFTATSCGRSFWKGFASPMPWCKVLYFTSSALNGVSCASSGLCLLASHSCIGPVPIITGAVAYGTSVAARSCTAAADCMDPAAGLTGTAINTCIDLATKKWS